MELTKEQKRYGAIAIVAILVIGGAMLLFSGMGGDHKGENATLQDLLNSRSERKEGEITTAVTDSSPMYSLISTPVTMYYDDSRENHASPMMVYMDQPDMASNPANDFLDHYESGELLAVGDVDGLSHDPTMSFYGSPKVVSTAMARYFWSSSDGAVLVEDDEEAYQEGLYGSLLASYLNIPVIVADRVDGDVRDTLSCLGVKYTIVCGEMDGYGKEMRFETPEDAQQMTIDLLSHPQGFSTESRYITMANPMDAYGPDMELVDEQIYSGEVFHIYNPGPGAYAGLEEAGEGDDYEYTVPQDVKNGIFEFEMTFKPHPQDEIDGERIYCFVFYEGENGWEQIYYMGTCAGVKDGSYETVTFEVPVLGSTGNYKFHVEGRNTYEVGAGALIQQSPVPYTLRVTLNSMDSPVYANMDMLSAVAPYQCAYRHGILLAKEDYAMQYEMMDNQTGAFEPAVHPSAHDYVNAKAWEIKDDELRLIAKMLGMEEPCTVAEDNGRIINMADSLYSDPVYVSIVADTNMIPHFYHEGSTHASEGYGQAGDIIYCDVDMSREDPRSDMGSGIVAQDVQDYELPIGRFAGYDVMDVSALIARNFFYYDIIDNYWSHGQDTDSTWKDNGYVFLGSKMPVESMYGTYVRTLSQYWNDGGLDVIGTTEERSDYKLAHQFQEGSNYIMGGVHGNFYWYVPQCHIDSISGGSAYDVTNVLDMSMGPSTMFLVSCITGRIDGLSPENCLSMAYIHTGVASYVGATRSTLGWIDPGLEFDMRPFEPEGAVLMSEMYAENLLNDMDAGTALRDAKNSYLPADLNSGSIRDESFIMVQHYVLFGDPAFNPYEP